MSAKSNEPGILRNSKRPHETRWQRYWRKRRMNSLRNSSDHAVFMAVCLIAIAMLLGALLYFGMKGARFEAPELPGGSFLHEGRGVNALG